MGHLSGDLAGALRMAFATSLIPVSPLCQLRGGGQAQLWHKARRGFEQIGTDRVSSCRVTISELVLGALQITEVQHKVFRSRGSYQLPTVIFVPMLQAELPSRAATVITGSTNSGVWEQAEA